MFASLGRIDMVLRPDAEGRNRYIQNDSRTRAEIETMPSLSVLFAVMRVLGAARYAGVSEPKPIVWYCVPDQPPDYFHQAIAAAGGQLMLLQALLVPIPINPPPPLQAIVTGAMAGLVRDTMKEHGVPLNLDGLSNLQETLAESAGRPDDNDYTYWSAVVKLGAFAGELIRATNGGTWDSVGSGTLPLALVTNFKGEQATVNPLGKAMKRFQNGTEDSLVPLVKATQSNSTKSNEDYRVELTPLEVDNLVWTPDHRN